MDQINQINKTNQINQTDRANAQGWVVSGQALWCAGRRILGRCSGRIACHRRDASSSEAGTRCRGDQGGRVRVESGSVLME
jgi:hypothetical protein